LKDPTLINRQLASLGWCREGRYIAAVAKVLDDDAVLQELLCSNIENSSDGKTVIAGPDVVAVFPLRADEGTERIETWLATFAHSNGSRVGVSDAFSGFEGLPVYAEQARVARKFADGAVREHNDGGPEVMLARYADHALEDLLSHLDSVYDIDIFCDPSVSVLRAYDEAHGGDLLHTLEVYLTCDCSLLESSRALVIHRNTMVYRMRRIVELTGMDLNDSQTLVRLSLSVRLLTARKATQ